MTKRLVKSHLLLIRSPLQQLSHIVEIIGWAKKPEQYNTYALIHPFKYYAEPATPTLAQAALRQASPSSSMVPGQEALLPT